MTLDAQPSHSVGGWVVRRLLFSLVGGGGVAIGWCCCSTPELLAGNVFRHCSVSFAPFACNGASFGLPFPALIRKCFLIALHSDICTQREKGAGTAVSKGGFD